MNIIKIGSDKMIKLIVGLGNPGKEYENTRHNIGFMALDNYIKTRNLSFDKDKFNGMYTEEIIDGNKIIYLKPLKYMNLSGEVVSSVVNYYKIDHLESSVFEVKVVVVDIMV